jgi:hypothetical protein
MIWYIFFVVLLVYLFSNQIMIYRRDLYICVILKSLNGFFSGCRPWKIFVLETVSLPTVQNAMDIYVSWSLIKT